MTRKTTPRSNFLRSALTTAVVLALTLAANTPFYAQQIFGTITGTIHDASGAAVPDVNATARNVATNLTVTARS
jgi:hypothetical protein